jgi:hypothetical protein
MEFIELTNVYDGKVYINFSQVYYIEERKSCHMAGKFFETLVCLQMNREQVFVKEDYEFVTAKINKRIRY